MDTSMNTNVDPRELDKFAVLAARWWDRDSEFKPLHDINPLRLKYIESRAQGLSGKKVLDVGCGGGILSESMARSGASVTGIDMSNEPLNVARLHLYESGVKVDYQQITAEALANSAAGSFDIVTCMEMLEHVPNPASVIQACQRLVKPNGHVFFSTLNRNLKAYLLAVVGAEYVLQLLPKGTHDYAKFIQPSELAAWAEQADLTVKNFTGIGYNPFTKHYYLNNDVSVNYLVHTQSN
jgi:2-polyprenyl-6-hydroxyphenyl methylase/3-demethylubiquinone-9 3-methyltransferase